MLRTLVAFVLFLVLRLMDHDVGVQSAAVLEDFSAELANSFLILVDVFIVEAVILLVIEESKALGA